MFKNIGIIGFGLIGGSMAKALKSHMTVDIAAYSRSAEPLERAYNDRIIDRYTTSDMLIFSGCDIIFICTPADKIASYVSNLTKIVKKECIITDVGSTKDKICRELERFDINFIGGHPMTGSEQTGYEYSSENLFENAYYVITPGKKITANMLCEFINLIKITGALPMVMESEEHDYAAAAISHIPHIAAASLVNMVKTLDNDKEYMHTLAAGGFKSITRIASSSPEMWKAICFENKNKILNVIEEYIKMLQKFHSMLENENYDKIFDFFEISKNYRNTFEEIHKIKTGEKL